MPMRAFRASTAYAGAHVKDNMWLWIAFLAVATAVFAVAVWIAPRSNVWAHVVTISGMVLGTLIMIKSQEGYVPPYAADDDEDESLS